MSFSNKYVAICFNQPKEKKGCAKKKVHQCRMVSYEKFNIIKTMWKLRKKKTKKLVKTKVTSTYFLSSIPCFRSHNNTSI